MPRLPRPALVWSAPFLGLDRCQSPYSRYYRSSPVTEQLSYLECKLSFSSRRQHFRFECRRKNRVRLRNACISGLISGRWPLRFACKRIPKVPVIERPACRANIRPSCSSIMTMSAPMSAAMAMASASPASSCRLSILWSGVSSGVTISIHWRSAIFNGGARRLIGMVSQFRRDGSRYSHYGELRLKKVEPSDGCQIGNR